MAFRMIRVDQTTAAEGVEFHWGSIFSGTFMILGLGLFFLLLGNAIGLSVNNFVRPTASGALRFWSFIYFAGTMILSYYAGSLVGTRSSVIENTGSGAVHGIVAWGFSSFLGALLVGGPGGNRLLLGTGPNVGNWLVLCIIGLGFLAAAAGGASGKKIVRYQRVREEEGGAPATRRVA